MYATNGGTTRAQYNQGWTKNDGALLPYGQTGNFERSSGSIDAGSWSGVIFDSLTAGQYIQVEAQAISNATGLVNADYLAPQVAPPLGRPKTLPSPV